MSREYESLPRLGRVPRWQRPMAWRSQTPRLLALLGGQMLPLIVALAPLWLASCNLDNRALELAMGATGSGGAGGETGTGGRTSTAGRAGADWGSSAATAGVAGGTGTMAGAAGVAGSPIVQATAGSSGAAGSSPLIVEDSTCANGYHEDFERCDDGNRDSGDGCSAWCTVESCDQCKARRACWNANLEPLVSCSVLRDAGERDRCREVLGCYLESGCYEQGIRRCYCGSVDPTLCFVGSETVPAGPCKETIDAAMESQNLQPWAIEDALFDVNHPVGLPASILACERNLCSEACGYPDGGSSGAGAAGGLSGGAGAVAAGQGGDSVGGAGGVVVVIGSGGEESLAGTGGAGGGPGDGSAGSPPLSPCEQCQVDECAYFLSAVHTQCGGQWTDECGALRSCYGQSGCGAPGGADPLECFCGNYDSTDCFVAGGDHDGACISEVASVAATTDLTLIGVQWTASDTRLGAINQLLFCQIDHCAALCFE